MLLELERPFVCISWLSLVRSVIDHQTLFHERRRKRTASGYGRGGTGWGGRLATAPVRYKEAVHNLSENHAHPLQACLLSERQFHSFLSFLLTTMIDSTVNEWLHSCAQVANLTFFHTPMTFANENVSQTQEATDIYQARSIFQKLSANVKDHAKMRSQHRRKVKSASLRVFRKTHYEAHWGFIYAFRREKDQQH